MTSSEAERLLRIARRDLRIVARRFGQDALEADLQIEIRRITFLSAFGNTPVGLDLFANMVAGN